MSVPAPRRPTVAAQLRVAAAMVLVGVACGCAGSTAEPTTADAEPSRVGAGLSGDLRDFGGADDAGSPTEPTSGPSEFSEPPQETQGEEQGEDPDRSESPKPTSNPNVTGLIVARAVDGDTIELGNGRSVRVIGIDTPERGQCHYDTAKAAMHRLVAGKRVKLTRVDEDTDRYDRLLRYVDVGATDAGLEMIKQGLAIARYDSRDGYGFHPREPRYLRTDNSNPQRTCAPKPQPRPVGGSSNCAAGYSPCIPPYPPDVDCADVDGPIRVSGSDPHGLDRDGDGVACE